MSMVLTGCPSGLAPSSPGSVAQDPSAFVTEAGGRRALDLMVRGARCGGCMSKIESALLQLPGVELARLNLSTGRLRIEWKGTLSPKRITDAVTGLGYGASAVDPAQLDNPGSRAEKSLLIAMAVAGIATAGVMLMSEAVWFGVDMPAETRSLLHWLSAVIAVPATLYSGRTFFESALVSLRRWRLNMDVPISLAVLLALVLSLHATATGGDHTYFDASVMLLFFLLIGRFLDARLRRQAYAAANALAAMQVTSVSRLDAKGMAETVRASEIRPGDRLLIAAGERLPVNAEVLSGQSEADLRLVTGEVEPSQTFPGQMLHAGSINLSAPIEVRALAPASQSLMADIARLLEAGEQKKSAYRRIADKAVAAYVPQVHAMAMLGFVSWLAFGASIPQAAFIAVTVLIITCPCAIALAAPLVQVVAAGRLFREGVYLSSGDALERIATVDHVVFDKTGTLTLGDPVLVRDGFTPAELAAAAQLARGSRHPFSRAISEAAGAGPVAQGLNEYRGDGISGLVDGCPAMLGHAKFVGMKAAEGSSLWFLMEGAPPVMFRFEDRLRPDASLTMRKLCALGLTVELLSGDSAERVERAASAAGISSWRASATPQFKVARLQELEGMGKKVLMVGDGLNDAAALASAHASLAPGGAVDVSRLASDCVYSGDSLDSIPRIIEVARKARQRIRENFAMAAIYNMLAVPIALFGFATPMVAAIAMSASSAVVTLNALRLAGSGKWRSEERI
jgi:Cu2+-exporting ATPase